MKKIILFSGTRTTGHIQAAMALKKEFKKYKNLQLWVLDSYDCLSPFSKYFCEDVHRLHYILFPNFYQKEFELIQNSFIPELVRKIGFSIAVKKIKAQIEKIQPDVIIATQTFASGIAATLKREYNNFLLFQVYTDFYHHKFREFKEIDYHYVPCKKIAEQIINAGINSKKVIATGIPINSAFYKNISKDELNEFKKELNLNENKLIILIMNGSLALDTLKILDLIKKISKLPLPLQFIIICGKNKNLKKKIIKFNKTLKNNLKVFDFIKIEEVVKIMKISDLYIGKAGGLSITEALASNLPIIIFNPLPGCHELNNTKFIVKNHLGFKANNFLEIKKILKEFVNNPQKLKLIKQKIEKFNENKKPASKLIVEHVLSLI